MSNNMNPFDPAFLTPFPGMAALTNRPARQPIDFLSLVSPILQQLHAKQEGDDQDRQRAIDNALKQQQLGVQQGALAETTRYHDIENQRYQATDARLNKSENDKLIAQIQQALPQAQAEGDQAKVQSLLQQLGRVTGWQMGEYGTNYQPQAPGGAAPAPAPPGAPPPTGGQGGPSDFDSAYQAMTQKESGGNPRAVNPQSGAMGTFQLMPNQLPPGVTKEQFLAMSPEQQKDVYKTSYLPSHGLDASTLSPGDVGLSVGAPAAIGLPDEAIVYARGSKAVAQNPTWDRNRDGQISAGELRQNYGGKPGGPPAGIAAPDSVNGLSPDVAAALKPGMQPSGAPGQPPASLRDFMAGQPPPMPGSPSGPMPWEMLGLGAPPPNGPATAEDEVPGGGRFVFKDASGKTVYEYDRNKVQGDQRTAVQQGLQPLVDNASTDAERKAARDAIGFATGAVGNGLTPKDAFTQGMAFYKDRVNSADKTARANVSPQLGSIKLLHKDSEDIHKDTVKQYHLDALNDSEADIDSALTAISAHNGLGDTAALAHFAQSMTKRLTDFEFKNFANAAPIMDRAMGYVNQLLTGQRTPEVMQALTGLLQQAKQQNAQQRQAAGDNAAQAILSGEYPGIPDDLKTQYADRARNRLMGIGTPSAQSAPTATPSYSSKSLGDLEKELGQ